MSAIHGKLSDFGDVLAPMSLASFRDVHWNKSAVLLPGRPDRFTGLAFDFSELQRNMQLSPGAEVKAQYFDRHREHKEIVGIDPSKMHDFFKAGMTICVTRVDPFLPDLSARVESWRRSLQFAGRMNFSCYWSPDGAGFGLHYDDRHVFICQIEGSKRWWFSRQPAILEPQACYLYRPESLAEMRASGLDLAEPHDEDLVSVVLEPGDMLYLPAGTWHKTSAVGESLALTLRTFEATPAHVVGTCLQRWFSADQAWRRALPLVSKHDSPDGSLPPPISLELGARLDALKAFVSELTVTDLARAWTEAQVPAQTPVARIATVGRDDRLSLDDHVRILRARSASGQTCFFIHTGEAELELDLHENPWLERLVAAGTFTAATASDWTGLDSWEETRTVLEELVARGVLRVAT